MQENRSSGFPTRSDTNQADGMKKIRCKYEEDPIKNEGARMFTIFSPL